MSYVLKFSGLLNVFLLCSVIMCFNVRHFPSQARKAIDSAYIEATTNANCIGLVKLMGSYAQLRRKAEEMPHKRMRAKL